MLAQRVPGWDPDVGRLAPAVSMTIVLHPIGPFAVFAGLASRELLHAS
jgi:hypothetical protein